MIQPQNIKHERKTVSRKTHKSYKYQEIVKITAYVCKHTRIFHGFWEILNKRNKCGTKVKTK